MSDIRQTPLHHYLGQTSGPSDAGVIVRELAFQGFLTLRGDGNHEPFRKEVKEVLGVDLPIESCTFANSVDRAVYWLGPSEWLVLVASETEGAIEATLRRVLTGHYSIVDVSGGQTLINLSGAGVEKVLKKSCTYDFHPRHFPSGRCVQTNFALAIALVSRKSNESFDVVIRRSFADYVAKWLLDAGREFGCRIMSREDCVSH